MLKRIFILILFFYSLGMELAAQNGLRRVNWDETQLVSYGDSQIQYPIFREQIPLQFSSGEFKAKLLNPYFREVEPDEYKLLEGVSIQEKILIKSEKRVISNKPSLYYEFIPLRKNLKNGKIEKLISFDLELEVVAASSNENSFQFKSESVLSSGRWFKIKISEDGVYKLTRDQLLAMGLDVSSVNPRNLRIYGNGGGMLPESNDDTKYDDLIENAIEVVGESDGSFDTEDYVLFYGQSPHRWGFNEETKDFEHLKNIYSDFTYYFINADLGVGKRIKIQEPLAVTPNFVVDEFEDHIAHENDDHNLINSGRNWYGEVFDATTVRSFGFEFPNLLTSKDVQLDVGIAARSSSISSMDVSVNGNAVNKINVSGINFSIPYPPYARLGSMSSSFKMNNENFDISLNYTKPNPSSMAWLDYIRIIAWRKLIFSGKQMQFRNSESLGEGRISKFLISQANASVRIWNLTNPQNVSSLNASQSGNELSFVLATDSLLEFVVFDGEEYLSAEFVEEVANQNYHGQDPVDFIIISPGEFKAEAERLGQFHLNNDGLSYCVVDPDLIYNEFSSGAQDISAIRNFIRMLYKRGNTGNQPKYLLLFGDASFDYKDRISDNTNFVPTWESSSSTAIIVSYNTDDFYGLLDGGEGFNVRGGLDIGIGRIPVRNLDQARQMVDKIIHYSGNSEAVMGSWRNTICLVGDDQDNNTYVRDSEQMASFIDNSYSNINTDKIYFDAYPQVSTPGGQRYPEVKKAINDEVKKGALLINYIGHGGETGWAHERVLEVQDINAWTNINRLPVFVTATCEFTRFDNPELESAGELVLLNENGGGIALLTTTRATSAGANFQLNKQVFKHVFEKENGEYQRLGDIIKNSKNAIGNGTNAQKFVLVGDPALRLALPQDSIATLEINHHPTQASHDTLKAMAEVNVKGSIYDKSGVQNQNFNGILYPVVYDKSSKIRTLGQDNNSFEQEFEVQSNILYKGKVSVINGNFEFTFVVPKDIAYNYDFGRISYYAQSDEVDAWGCYEDIIIGGFSEAQITDNEGPSIQLYLNDKFFENGGLTNSKPFIYANISDESGINTLGNGIGHDIVAVIDENYNQSYVLNEFFESDLDSHKTGSIIYPLSELAPGKHNLELKVWDILNNSSTAMIEFEVVDDTEALIQDLKNFPNPFSAFTYFSFNHNQANKTINFEIQIFALDGKKVKSILKSINPGGFSSGNIFWNATSDSGSKLDAGIYLYRILIDGSEIDGAMTKKMIIIN